MFVENVAECMSVFSPCISLLSYHNMGELETTFDWVLLLHNIRYLILSKAIHIFPSHTYTHIRSNSWFLLKDRTTNRTINSQPAEPAELS